MKPTRQQIGKHSELQVASQLIRLGLSVALGFSPTKSRRPKGRTLQLQL